MAKISVTLRKGRDVYLRVSHKRKHRFKKLFSIDERFWAGDYVRKSHPRATEYNQKIDDAVYEYKKRVQRLERVGSFTVEDIMDDVDGGLKVWEYIKLYAQNKPHTSIRKYLNLSDHFHRYAPAMIIEDLDLDKFKQFGGYLRATDGINSSQTVHRYLKFLKSVLKWQFEKGNYHDRKVLSYNVPKGSSRPIEKLTKEEVKRIAECDVFETSRDAFLCCLYLNGTRIRDVLLMRPIDLNANRVTITEQKTGKIKEVKVRPEVQEIIDTYKGQSEYIIPVLTMRHDNPKVNIQFYKHIEDKVTAVNRELKLIAKYCKITKNLTTKTARHTFAYWADLQGLTSRQIQHLLNHSSLTTTEDYLKRIRASDEQDEAQDKVFG